MDQRQSQPTPENGRISVTTLRQDQVCDACWESMNAWGYSIAAGIGVADPETGKLCFSFHTEA